ncbi:hypothetical protein ABT337_22145 [Saccharopolyspora hirsuta]|uniref:hypothetical protein n=1 Tax=Saccharopolyspora hirsuta TaxID=1837 RepID=UPI001FEB7457|nr:hypothetical protein [Saccharopolyspora hirsuta]
MSRPQHHKAVRLRLIPAAIGLGAVVALAGCSAGQVTETDTQVAAVNGGNGDVQDIAIRNAMFTFPTTGTVYPAGSSAPLEAVLANEGENDKLVEVTSTYTTAPATIGGDTTLPSRTALHATGASAEQKAQVEAAGGRQVQITLNGFKQDITPGVTIPVTFVFEKAGPVTVQVPVGIDHSPRPEQHDSESGH